MKYNDYRWYINDSLTSVNRLFRKAPELEQFFHDDYLKRDRTKKFGDLEKYYLDTLEEMEEMLKSLKHYHAATINKYYNASEMLRIVSSIVARARDLSFIYDDMQDFLENENFNSACRILENEPETIYYNMTRIRDSFPDYLWR